MRLTPSAAITAGRARVGSTRVVNGGEPRWLFRVEGEPVDRATELVHEAAGPGVVVAKDTAAVLRDGFALQSVGDGTYRVLRSSAGGVEPHAAREATERAVTTILVTDIVDSTGIVERIGDRAWGELVAAHEEAIRAELVLQRGEEVDTTGDGFLAAFDSPARAIRCAFAIRERVAELGLTIRAGIHTGEVERIDGTFRGIAVHVASRIAAAARGAEILVSATTRELAAGAGLAFDDRGVHALKGVSEPRRLYAASPAAADPA
jgi:class 3 adenylate cyclase